MRTLTLIPALIAFTATTVLAQSEIYLSARADRKDGTGAAADPLNASTQAKFDAIFASLKPNTAVHIGAGTYHTKGEASFRVQPNTKIRGAGMEVTKIIQDGTGKPRAWVFREATEGAGGRFHAIIYCRAGALQVVPQGDPRPGARRKEAGQALQYPGDTATGNPAGIHPSPGSAPRP
jgi:hypothetical protein